MQENGVIYETQKTEIRPLETVRQEIISLTRQAQVNTVHYACEIGKRLIEAKAQVGHGAWGEWLKNEVDYSQSTAENFMRIYKEYGNDQMSLFSDFENSQTIGKLDVSKLLLLTAIPEDEREDFAKEADAENISVRELKEKIRERESEIAEQKTQAEKLREQIDALKRGADDKAQKIEDMEKTISGLKSEISEKPSDDMQKIRNSEISSEVEKYEKKLSDLKKKHKKELEKKTAAENKLKEELKTAKESAEAAAIKAAEIEKEVKKASLTENSDLVLINDCLKRFQTEAGNAEEILRRLKNDANFDKLKTAAVKILTSISERIGEL